MTSDFAVAARQHGILMLLSWGLILPLAAICSFGLRRAQANELTFFRIHHMFAGTGIMLAITGWFVACRNFGAASWKDNPHGLLGTIVMVGSICNIMVYPLMGKPVEEMRNQRQKIVAVIHLSTGYTLILLAWVAIYLAARYEMVYMAELVACWITLLGAAVLLYCYYNYKRSLTYTEIPDASPEEAISRRNT